jgi:hypothetical protein
MAASAESHSPSLRGFGGLIFTRGVSGAATCMAETAAAGSSAAPDKVIILFKATGDAPILKQDKVKARARAAGLAAPSGARFATEPLQEAHARVSQINAAEPFSKVVAFLRVQLQRDSLVRAWHASFPPPSAFAPRGARSQC